MSGLYHTLGVGAESLFTTRQGVDTAGHNIANAQTEGFSRQRVNVGQRDPSHVRNVIIGNGVFVKNISRAHDRYLEKHLNETTQQFGQSESYFQELSNIEDVFSPELNASIADEMSDFFNRLRDLSNLPEDLTARTAVREKASSLADAFLRVDYALRLAQSDVNDRIVGETSEINKLLDGIASLNVNIQNLEAGDQQEANDLRDQQDRMVRQLSEKMEVNYYRGDMGMIVLRGPAETLLVDRGHSASVEAIVKPDTPNHWDLVVVDDQGRQIRRISEPNSGGHLRALFDVRDQVIGHLLSQNNELAFSLANEVNRVHRRGFGLNSYKNSTGRDFFTLDGGIGDAARSIRVSDHILRSTDAISAASSPDAPGDNVVVNNIIRLENSKVLSEENATFNDFYANYVGVFGLEVVRARNTKEANGLLLNDLKSRREAISGVSMDEEATNLLKWQANFTASSRVITTVDEMLETVLGLKR